MANNLIVCGGTFDRFHKGHMSLLKLAFSLGTKVVIGVTSDIYVQNSKFKIQNSKLIEAYEERKKAVESFFKQEGVLERAEVVKIDNAFGPTLDRKLAIDAIVVSEDTKKGAEIINRKRKEAGLKDLRIIVVPSIYDEDGKLISSARIRNGEINREGMLYAKSLWFKTDLTLPENLRGEFRRPFGELLLDVSGLSRDKNNLVITVGDITTKIFNERSLGQNLSVIDFKVARRGAFSSFSGLGFSGNESVITAKNPASHITRDLFSKVLNIFKRNFDKRVILKIAGEEDLAVLPLILMAPLSTIIYYGQPDTGLVKILVSEKTKETVYGLVTRFETITRGY